MNLEMAGPRRGWTDVPRADVLLSAKQVATWLGVSETWIRAHATGQRRPKQPEIPCIRLGTNVRFRRDAIEAWLKQLAIATGGRR
jgi:excisionase family DNA binding protein